MAQYKVTANAIGEWTQGQIITDDDLAARPQFGGVARLRDDLKAIEDHYEKPPRQPAPATVTRISADGTGESDAPHGKTVRK